MTGLTYQTLDAAKGWSVAWIALTALGALSMFGGRSKRGNASTNLGLLGIVATLPASILEAKLIFGQITTAADFKTVNDLGPVFAALRFFGWAMVILALIVAKTPHPSVQGNPFTPDPVRIQPQLRVSAAELPRIPSFGTNVNLPQSRSLAKILALGAAGALALTVLSGGGVPGIITGLHVLVTLGLVIAAVAVYPRQTSPHLASIPGDEE